MLKTRFFKVKNEETLICTLCPHFCPLKKGETGKCRARKNVDGKIDLLTYGQVASVHLDPIEKKPLYHFFPGGRILSVGSTGCNLGCFFCQNYEISQIFPNEYVLHSMSDTDIIHAATSQPGNIGIAYTYNEPLISFEFYYQVAQLAAIQKMKNVFVSNGFFNPEPLNALLPFVHAWNIDLKGFTSNFYSEYTGGTLQPVLNNLKSIRKAGCHLEITNLLIPGLNDQDEVFFNMVKWIKDELGADTPLHLSRYFPRYKSTIEATPPKTLQRCYEIAKEHLANVYVGNICLPDTSNTYCPTCHTLAIARNGYNITNFLSDNGACVWCKQPIAVMQ